MTYEEAIEIIKADALYNPECAEICLMILPKQISKPPLYIKPMDADNNADVICPVCHCSNTTAINAIHKIHCWNCGQVVEWEDK